MYNTSLYIVSIMKQIITSSISINISEDFISESDIVSDRHINYKIKKKKYYIQMLITDEEESAWNNNNKSRFEEDTTTWPWINKRRLYTLEAICA